MSQYLLHGKMMAKTGFGEELKSILLAAAEMVKTAEGCHFYIVGVNAEEPDAVYVTELWESRAAHENSLKLPGVSELVTAAMPYIDGRPEKGQELEVVGGKLC